METTANKINIRVISNTKDRLDVLLPLLNFLVVQDICGMLDNLYMVPVRLNSNNSNQADVLFNALQLNSNQSGFHYNCYNLNKDA